MTETKLPSLSCDCGVITQHCCDNCKVLLAHEKDARKMLKCFKGHLSITNVRIRKYWRGRLEAVQSLRGGTK